VPMRSIIAALTECRLLVNVSCKLPGGKLTGISHGAQVGCGQ